MKRENRKKLSKREWASITSRRPVVRRIRKPDAERQKHAGAEDLFRREREERE